MCGKTNTQSNTAFRGFGGPQGAIAIEYIIDEISRAVGKDPLDVRKLNFYGREDRNVTPYGQTVEDNVIHELVDELEKQSDYRKRRDAIRAFNENSPVLKKGIALTPVKFGISFNVVHFNQAGALVHIYTDGSILVNHGGTEMGQGLNTKVAQVVAGSSASVSIGCAPRRPWTDKVANTSPRRRPPALISTARPPRTPQGRSNSAWRRSLQASSVAERKASSSPATRSESTVWPRQCHLKRWYGMLIRLGYSSGPTAFMPRPS